MWAECQVVKTALSVRAVALTPQTMANNRPLRGAQTLPDFLASQSLAQAVPDSQFWLEQTDTVTQTLGWLITCSLFVSHLLPQAALQRWRLK